MLAHHMLDKTPFIESGLTDFIYAAFAKVFYLGFIRVADSAKVIEMDIDDEIFRDYLILVFTDVFRTQLHLTCLNVVTSLYERCVKHDTEHHLIRKACMLKNYLYIALE